MKGILFTCYQQYPRQPRIINGKIKIENEK